MFTHLHTARNTLSGSSSVPPTLLFAVAQRKAAAMEFSAVSVEQRAVGLSWLSRSERKKLDFVLLGKERLLWIREDPPFHTQKKNKTTQNKTKQQPKTRAKISESF